MGHAKLLLFRFLTSLKTWTALIGLTSTWLAKRGIILGPDVAEYVAGFFALLLATQGLADHGKAKATIEAKATVEAAALAPSSSPANQLVVIPPPEPDQPVGSGGFVATEMLLLLCLFSVVFAGVIAIGAGCGPMKTGARGVAGDVVDCLKPDAKDLVDQFGPTTEDLIRNTLNGDKIDRDAVKNAMRGYASAKAECVMASALSRLLAESAKPPDPNAPASEGLKVDETDARSAAKDLFGGRKFKTASGEL